MLGDGIAVLIVEIPDDPMNAGDPLLHQLFESIGDAKLPASKDEQGEEQRETERLLSYLMEIEQEITVLWNVIREPFGMQPEQPWENLLLKYIP